MEAVSVKKIFALTALLLVFACGGAFAFPLDNFGAELDKLYMVSDAKLDMILGAHHRTIKEQQEGFVKKTCVWKRKGAKQTLGDSLMYVTVSGPGWKVLGLQVGDKNGANVKTFTEKMKASGFTPNPDMGVASDYVGEYADLRAGLPGVAFMKADHSRWFRVIYNAGSGRIAALSWGVMAQ